MLSCLQYQYCVNISYYMHVTINIGYVNWQQTIFVQLIWITATKHMEMEPWFTDVFPQWIQSTSLCLDI